MKKFTLKVVESENKITFASKNEGFTALEVLGILHRKIKDIHDQMDGNIKPEIFKRKLEKK